MNDLIPESERPTREGMLPAVVAVVSTGLCLLMGAIAFLIVR